MRKLVAFCAAALVCGAMMTGCEYDDGDLWNKVGELDSRVDGLEKTVGKTNSDLEALRLFGLDVQSRKGKTPGWFIGERDDHGGRER